MGILLCLLAAQTFNGFDVSIHGHGQTFATRDGNIYYEKIGHGPVIVMVAGGPGGGHTSFHGFFERLATDHTVVFFDNIGRGRSDRLKNPKGYTVWRDADDIEALRKHLNVDRITVIGHSYGGMPALAYSVRYGDHLERVVLSDTLHSAAGFQENIDSCNSIIKTQFPERWNKILKLRAKGVLSTAPEYGEAMSGTLDNSYWYNTEAHRPPMFGSKDPKDGFNEDVYKAMLGDDTEWIVKGTMASFDPRPQLKNVKCPVLICVGRWDRVSTPQAAFEMLNCFDPKIATMLVFEKSGHRPWVEETNTYFNAVERFLKR